jgi:hypothetical protein
MAKVSESWSTTTDVNDALQQAEVDKVQTAFEMFADDDDMMNKE